MRHLVATLLATLALTNNAAATAQTHGQPLFSDAVHACVMDARGCGAMSTHLEARMLGNRGGSVEERAAARDLAVAATEVVQHPAGNLRVAANVSLCRAGASTACEAMATLLDGLFAGDDARLARGSRGDLARALATLVLEAAGTTNEVARRGN